MAICRFTTYTGRMNVTLREEVLPLTPHAQQILTALALSRMNGYEIMRQIREDTGGMMVMQSGALYPALRNFVKMGFIVEAELGVAARPGRLARVYELTEVGWWVLEGEIKRQEKLAGLVCERLAAARVLGVERESGAANIAAAFGELGDGWSDGL